MGTLFELHVRGSRSSSYTDGTGNISIALKHRFQKRYQLPSNGREIILQEFTTSPYHYPSIQFHPNALASPMFLYRTLMVVLDLGDVLSNFLDENISDTALLLSAGGLRGFYLVVDVEIVQFEVVEDIELSRIAVEKLSMKKPKRDVKQGETCAVCLDELKEETAAAAAAEGKTELVVIALPCDHLFHATCISRWFEKKMSCPLCRRGIKTEYLFG